MNIIIMSTMGGPPQKQWALGSRPGCPPLNPALHRRRNRGGGGGGGGGEGALAPPILGVMCIKYAEFILDTPFGPPQSCFRSNASGLLCERDNASFGGVVSENGKAGRRCGPRSKTRTCRP